MPGLKSRCCELRQLLPCGSVGPVFPLDSGFQEKLGLWVVSEIS